MKIILLQHTPLEVCTHAIRTCWQSFDKSDSGGEKDKELIDRVGNKFKHASTLEHLIYTFYIQGISRAVLQELARHRIASLSVKSTRYTLKELKNEDTFLSREKRSNEEVGDFFILAPDLKRASKYIVLTDNDEVNKYSVMALENLRQLLIAGVPNDKAKYALPECYKTELTWTINARSLQNFLELRSDKSALWEIRNLAYKIYNTMPDDHKYLFTVKTYEK